MSGREDTKGSSGKTRKRTRDSTQEMGCCQSKDQDSESSGGDPKETSPRPDHSPHKKQKSENAVVRTCSNCSKLVKENSDIREKLERVTSERDKEKKTYQDDCKKANSTLGCLQSEKYDLTEKLDRAKEMIETLEKTIPSLKKQLYDADKRNDQLLNRVSELAGAKISTGNPNLVDISDANRPSKLAERYNELYDNDWTDAFALLTENGIDEKLCIDKLREVLMIIYNECRAVMEEDLKLFDNFVVKSFHYDLNSTEATVLKKQYVDRRKKIHGTLKEDMRSKTEDRLKQSLSESEISALKKFTEETFDICILMCLQDPPVTIETEEPGNKFDTEKYKAYTKKGQFIDYVAWPPVRLHEGGPFLGKGIAQGTNKTKNTEKNTHEAGSKGLVDIADLKIEIEPTKDPTRGENMADAKGTKAPSATHPKGGAECAEILPAKTMLENEPVRTFDPESVSVKMASGPNAKITEENPCNAESAITTIQRQSNKSLETAAVTDSRTDAQITQALKTSSKKQAPVIQPEVHRTNIYKIKAAPTLDPVNTSTSVQVTDDLGKIKTVIGVDKPASKQNIMTKTTGGAPDTEDKSDSKNTIQTKQPETSNKRQPSYNTCL